MGKNKNKTGVVFSTNPDFVYEYEGEAEEPETLAPDQQRLHVRMERSGRGGKTVTVVDNFIGATADLEALGKTLKGRCGVGGSVKEGQILIQGDFRPRIIEILKSLGYSRTN